MAEDEPVDVFEQARREFERADAALQREYLRMAGELGVSVDLLKMRFEQPARLEQLIADAFQKYNALQSEQHALRTRAEELRRQADAAVAEAESERQESNSLAAAVARARREGKL